MGKVIKFTGPDRPESIMLMDAIEDAIYKIGMGKMTPFEILGVLSLVEKEFYKDTFGDT